MQLHSTAPVFKNLVLHTPGALLLCIQGASSVVQPKIFPEHVVVGGGDGEAEGAGDGDSAGDGDGAWQTVLGLPAQLPLQQLLPGPLIQCSPRFRQQVPEVQVLLMQHFLMLSQDCPDVWQVQLLLESQYKRIVPLSQQLPGVHELPLFPQAVAPLNAAGAAVSKDPVSVLSISEFV